MLNRPLAELKWSPVQRACFIGLLLGCMALAIIDWALFVWLFSLFLLLLYTVIVLCKVLAALFGLNARFTIFVAEEDYRALHDDALPVYTVLLPLYKESQVVDKLIAHIGRLDYPKDKLDVKLLLEHNDEETLRAIQRAGMPDWCELIIVPDVGPQTKPRACNAGLEQARGTYTVIFDAEDQPEPDQLKKAICAYKSLPDSVVCLQAKLNFFNDRERLLTRCFGLEYTTWFDLYLPGLHALAAPIPLGGTSNHFKTEVLRGLHGWDPYNVTEDCDLGIRIAEAGQATRIIDSVTWEEAPCHIVSWLGQRSRWIKGYFQTFWVHTRQPLHAIQQLGLWGFFQMLVTVGGQVATVFLNPLCWLILIAWLFWRWPIVYVHSPYTLGLFAVSLALFQFNVLFIGVHLLAALRRGSYHLIPAVLLLPWYWILISIGAWRGVLEFFWAPYKWVKTTHGMTHMSQAGDDMNLKQLDRAASGVRESLFIKPVSQEGLAHKLFMAICILLLCVLISGSSILAPAYFGYTARVEQARIVLEDNFIETERAFELQQASWIDCDRITVELVLNTAAQAQRSEQHWSQKDLRLMFYIKVRDGEWFHRTVDDFSVRDNHISITLPLDDGWQSLHHDFPWNRALLRRVRSFGVKTFSHASAGLSAEIISLKAQPAADDGGQPLAIRELDAATEAERYQVFEARWSLNQSYRNPFDSDLIACEATFTHEDGSSVTVPAFYTQDYRQYKSAEGEQLQPIGMPHWAVRFAPRRAGQYTWTISCRDSSGRSLSTPQRRLTVHHREHRGFLQLGSNKRYFAFENGEFFYPLSLNIRSPRDERNHEYYDFELPDKEDGSYVMFEFLNNMSKAGINVGRVWMSPWFGSIEWNADELGFHGLGVYNLQNAHRLDSIFEYARRHDIMIELALNHHGPFTQRYDSQWASNPYNEANGGPAQSPRDILTSDACKKLFKQRLRYISARYGAYPNLFCYVLWIEANVVDPRPHVLTSWHRELAPFLKRIDNGRHLVSTEFNNNGYPAIWAQDAIDYTQVAAYNHGGGSIREFLKIARLLRPYDKPAVIEEYMGPPSGGHTEVLAHEFHDGLWANWMLPFGGAPMPWWWNFLFEKDLHLHYQVFRGFIAGEDLSQVDWFYVDNMQLNNAPGLQALGRLSQDRAFFWIYKDAVANIRFGGPYRKRRAAAYQSYRKQVPKAFSAIALMTGKQDEGFMDVAGAALIIPPDLLQPGRYRVEFWDTWTARDCAQQELTIDAFPYALKLPALDKDIAIKLIALDP